MNSRQQQIRRQAWRLRGLQRILLVGCSGAGKSTLARRLGPILELPVVHLDREFWQSGWVQPDEESWKVRMRELLAQPAWVMDGNYSQTFESRVERAQAVIMLDFPRWLCLWRVLRRILKYLGRTRPDMTPGCKERFDWEFMCWIWNYPRRSRPKIFALLEQYGAPREVLLLRGPSDVKELVAALEPASVTEQVRH